MNNSITLGSDLPITASIPKQIPDYAFGWTNPLITTTKPKPFSTKGMVGTARNLYGIADLSKEYAKAEKDGTHQFLISNDEYMSRQTGIPADKYRKFRQATNKARGSLGLNRFLNPLPETLTIRTRTPWYATSNAYFSPTSINNRNNPNKTYAAVANKPSIASLIPYSIISRPSNPALHDDVRYNGLAPHKGAVDDADVANYLNLLVPSLDNPRTLTSIMDSLKHEVAHANTMPRRNYDDTDTDLLRYIGYKDNSPHLIFDPDTYFGEHSHEAWGAANRVKNDGAGLFYAKHGRLPGMDEYDAPTSLELKLKDIDELVDLFYDYNPGSLTIEHRRIPNQLDLEGSDSSNKVIRRRYGKLLIKDWLKKNPYTLERGNNGNDSDAFEYYDNDITNFDLARNNGPLQNVKMANINGLVKAASMQQDTKQLDKLLKLIVNEYKKEGYDLSNMKAKFSDTPVYNNGKKVPAGVMDPNSFGGSWTNKGIVYINPNRKGPMEYYGKNVTKDPEEFSRLIMAHELAHEIYRNHADDAYKDKIRKAIKDEGFTTDYLKNGVADNKLDEEGFAEYLAHRVMNRMPDKDKLEAALDTSVSNSLIKASGKIMKVQVSNMEYAKGSLAMRCMWPRYVYMPDCEKYRNIINGSSKSAKAKLAQKFWLNLPDSVKFAACDLVVVE